MAYEKFGLQAILDLSQYIKAQSEYVKKNEQMDASNQQLAAATKNLFSTVGKVLGVAGTALSAAGAGMVKLALDAKEIPVIAQTFDNLGGSIDVMVEATQGMVGSTELMKTFNQAAQLVGVDFAQKLPDAMGYLGKVSRATGESMEYMLNALVLGVGRLSPMILDNLGVQVNLTEANEAYAQSLGREVDSLTKAEQQTALMNVVMEKLATNTASMPDAMGSVDQIWGSFKNTLQDVKDSIGVALLPALQEVMKVLADLAGTYGPQVIAWAEDFGPKLQAGIIPALGKMLELGDALLSVADFLGQFDLKVLAVTGVLLTMTPSIVGVVSAISGAGGLIGALGALTTAMMANPVILVATAIAAAGLAIAKSVKRIREEEAQFIQQQDDMSRSIASTSESYAEYKERMLEALRVSMDVGEHYPEQLILQEAEAKGLMVSEQHWSSYAQIIEGEVGPALQGLKDGMMDTQTAMEAQVGAASEFYQGLVDHARKVEEIDGILAEAFDSDEFAEALEDMQDTAETQFDAMNESLADIMQGARDAEIDAQFNFNLERQQAEQAFQAEYNALIAAGREQEAADLAAKFADQESKASAAYSVQEQLRQRTILKQQLDQARAYVEELQKQRQFLIDRIMNQLEGSEKFMALNRAEKALMLSELGIDLAEQEKIELQHGINRVQIAHDSGVGVLNQMETTAEAALKILNFELDAARGIRDQLQSDWDNFSITLPELSGGDYGGGDTGKGFSGTAAKTKAAAKPLTATLDEVARDLDSSIKAVQDALDALPDIEVDEAAYAGLERMGEFVKRAMTSIYGWFDDPQYNLKAMIDDVKDYIAPLTEVFRLLDVGLNKAVPASSESYASDVDAYFGQVEFTGRHILDYLRTIADNPVWTQALEEAAAIVDNVVEVFKVLGITLTEEMTQPYRGEGAFEDLSIGGIKEKLGQIDMAGRQILDYLRQIASNPVWTQALAESAAIADNIVKVFKVLGVTLTEQMTQPYKGVGAFEDLSIGGIDEKLGQVDIAGRQIMDYLRTIASNPVWVQALDEASAIADNVVKVFKILDIGLTNLEPIKSFDRRGLQVKMGQIEVVGVYIMDYLRKIADNPVWTQALAEAADVAENVTKVFKVIELEFADLKPVASLDRRGLQVKMGQVELVGIYIMDYLKKISSNPVWTQALAEAAGIADNVTKVFAVLDINLAVTSPGVGFITRLTGFFEALKQGAPIVREGIKAVKEEWEKAGADIEADAGLTETIKKVFSILDLAGMINDLQVQTPLKPGQHYTSFSNVVVELFTDLEMNAAYIQEHLKIVDDLFTNGFDYSIQVSENIAAVFSNIGNAISAGMEIMNMSDEDNIWNINLLLNRIADLELAINAINNLTPIASGLGSIGIEDVPATTKTVGTDGVSIVQEGVIKALQAESDNLMGGAAWADQIRTAVRSAFEGTRMEMELNIVQDQAERRMVTFRIGRIERSLQTISMRLDTAGV